MSDEELRGALQQGAVPPAPPSIVIQMDPMAYYCTPAGGTVAFGTSCGEIEVTQDSSESPLLVVTNPANSGVAGRNWRVSVSASVAGVFRRYRGVDFSLVGGAVSLTPVNRGGGTNQPAIKLYPASQFTYKTKGVLSKTDYVAAGIPLETEVRGSVRIRPGGASLYTFKPQPGFWGVAAATVEWVWWEEPF